jgi:hypothetical protein
MDAQVKAALLSHAITNLRLIGAAYDIAVGDKWYSDKDGGFYTPTAKPEKKRRHRRWTKELHFDDYRDFPCGQWKTIEVGDDPTENKNAVQAFCGWATPTWGKGTYNTFQTPKGFEFRRKEAA